MSCEHGLKTKECYVCMSPKYGEHDIKQERVANPKREEHMNLNQGKVAGGLVDELLSLIHKYDESLYISTVIGCLELVKHQLINDHMENDDD